MELILPYYKEYLNAVCSFVEEIGRSHGASRQEALQLRLIGEETFVFILNGIPKVGLDHQFHLRCEEEENGLLLMFSNHGRPMNARNVPIYDPEKDSETADGLSLTMVRCFSYEFGYRNLGKDGWELAVRFHINDYKRLTQLNASDSDYEHEEQEPFAVRIATEADVPGIINLVYNTYHYSYAKDFFYNEKELTNRIASKKILSLVAVTESGKVIGHNAVLLDSDRLGEAGMSMVDPNYRRSKAFLSLVLNTARAVKTYYPELLCYAKCVTSHVRSQAFITSFTTCLFQLSVYHHAAFIGMKGDTNPRESLVYSICKFGKQSAKSSIYIPARHQGIIREIMKRAKLDVECLTANAEEMPESNSLIQTEILPSRQYAEFTTKKTGKDFIAELRKQTQYVRQNGVVTADLILPTAQPFAMGWDENLNRIGYFFCGIKPDTDGTWNLVYTNLLYQAFDFDKLQLFAEDSKELCRYVKEEYLKTLA